MSTNTWVLSAEGDPEFIYYNERCLYKLRTPMPDGRPEVSLTGTVITKDQFTEYADCVDCQSDHIKNTLFVSYDEIY